MCLNGRVKISTTSEVWIQGCWATSMQIPALRYVHPSRHASLIHTQTRLADKWRAEMMSYTASVGAIQDEEPAE
jgi:hypothetical protein